MKKITLAAIAIFVLILTLSLVLGGGSSNNTTRDVAYKQTNISNDKKFIEHIIPHHQEAVNAAQDVLDRGGEIYEVRKLAQDIIDTQKIEITDMRSWHIDWFGKEYEDTGGYKPIMRDLSGLSGKELDLAFTQDMIVYYEGAIAAAHQALEFSKHKEIINLSQNILKTQQEEIELMKKILAEYSE